MTQKIMCAVLTVILAGCGGYYETNKLGPVPNLQCLKLESITASSQLTADIIKEQLKVELQKNGLNVTDDCDYKLDVSVDSRAYIFESTVKLSDKEKSLVIWTYLVDPELHTNPAYILRTPVDFAKYTAETIAKTVK